MRRKIVASLLTCMMVCSMVTGCGTNNEEASGTDTAANAEVSAETETSDDTETANETEAAEDDDTASKTAAPKYVFLFIGDGMSYPQIELTNYYVSASSQDGTTVTVDGEEKAVLKSKNQLNMMDFETAGSAQTYDSTSFAPDSASTATSIATGHKTWSGSINVSEDFTEEYETIAEKLKKQKDYKIGIISSVNINHATPAAFYAHQASRNNYYEIGQELIDSNFDYFTGGALKKETGAEEDKESLYTLAEKAGYKVIKTQEEAEALTAGDGKAIVIDEHPDETLILVTGDHETGGLTIGYAGTDYDTFLTNLENQKISYAKFDSDYVSTYKENKTSFEDVMEDVTELFGLTAPTADSSAQKDSADKHPESEDDGTLATTEYEYQKLQEAYETTMSRTGEEEEFGQEEYVNYGSYEPLTVTITHILNNKSGINFGSYDHTGLPVEVLVKGADADLFDGYYDNTDIYNKLAAITGVK